MEVTDSSGVRVERRLSRGVGNFVFRGSVMMSQACFYCSCCCQVNSSAPCLCANISSWTCVGESRLFQESVCVTCSYWNIGVVAVEGLPCSPTGALALLLGAPFYRRWPPRLTRGAVLLPRLRSVPQVTGRRLQRPWDQGLAPGWWCCLAQEWGGGSRTVSAPGCRCG